MVMVTYALTGKGAFILAEGTGGVTTDDMEAVAMRRVKETGIDQVMAGIITGDRETLKLNCAIYNDYRDATDYARK